MSRSGYSDDGEHIALWRGQVASAIRGKRGQVFLRDLLAALDAMPEKRLVVDELEVGPETITIMGGEEIVSVEIDGGVCALGALGRARGMDMCALDPDDSDAVGEAFNIARQLACEIVYLNDECGGRHVLVENGYTHYWRYVAETPEERWARMRKWVVEHLIEWIEAA